MDAREVVLQHMDEEVTLLNMLAVLAEQSGMPGSAAIAMQCAESIERAAWLERQAATRGAPCLLS